MDDQQVHDPGDGNLHLGDGPANVSTCDTCKEEREAILENGDS